MTKPQMYGVFWGDAISFSPRYADEECPSLHEALDKVNEGITREGQTYAEIIPLKLVRDAWVADWNYPELVIDTRQVEWAHLNEED